MKDGDCRMFLNQMFLLLLHLVLSRETASAMGSGHALPGMKAFEPREQGRDRKSQTRGWQILRESNRCSVWTLAGLKSRLSLVLVGAARSRWARNEETP